MVNGKKIIGLCITKIYDTSYTIYMEQLRKYAAEENCKLIIFSCLTDFYEYGDCTEMAHAVYSTVNYEQLDGLIVMYDCFFVNTIPDRIIERAKAAGKPVLVINARIDGCLSVLGDFSSEYKALIRHVICDHNVKNAVFMAGFRGEINSEKRKKCFMEVMEEQGLTVNDDSIVYGDYWEVPAFEAMNSIKARGKGMPEAVICANDQMAMAVCEWLAENGYKVPDDVIVTGFDGIEPAVYFTPSITTCRHDWDKIAKYSAEMLSSAIDGRSGSSYESDIFSNAIGESCGCYGNFQSFRETAFMLHKQLYNMINHENFINRAYGKMFEITDLESMKECLSQYIIEASYVCINRDLLESYLAGNDSEWLTPVFDVVNSRFSRDNDIYAEKTLSLSDGLPCEENWLKDDSVFFLSAIFADNHVCGIYAVKSDNVSDVTNKIKRMDIVISNCFHALFNNAKQKQMRDNIANLAMINPITGLYNLKGITDWFNKFSLNPDNHKKYVSFSVYNIRKYHYIYENYGIAEIEKCLKYVGDTLKAAALNIGITAHITEDTFLIINVVGSEQEVSDTINETTGIFYRTIGERNAKEELYLEVNAGCTVANPRWDGLLSNFIRLANSELYINRIRYSDEYVNASSAGKEKEKKDFTEQFSFLVDRNLFSYFFQPIVDAKTGDIFAYEALMRTPAEIGMNPLEVLETAEQQGRLYEIERATIFNILRRLSEEFEKFGGRNIFINSIPGYFLNEEDNKFIGGRYSGLIKYLVIEITEQNTISDDELNTIKRLGNADVTVPIAVDDYGTGHSNIVNLMRYSPQIVKIDRFLISDVDKDINKQMFVKSTIDFARMNNMKVLAEGVETSEELRTVVSYGVDYIQGYYTGKPAPEPLNEIKPEIRQEILSSRPVISPESGE